MLCQTLVYREVTALFSLKSATPESGDPERLNTKDPWSKTLNWYFFAVTNYFLYGESIIYYFKVSLYYACSCARLDRYVTDTACRIRGCSITSICNESSHDQFHVIHNRIHGFCYVTQERLPQTAIRIILLGSHESLAHRRV